MEFRRYNSIDNVKEATLLWLHNNGLIGEDTTWIAQEKIHGANFSIYVDGNREVKYGKRSGFIGSDNFYNYQVIRDEYEFAAQSVADYLEAEEVIIYGEICGGFYPGMESPPGSKQVQKEVKYCAHNEFIVFDIMVNGEYLNDTRVAELCDLFGFIQAPVFAQGKFEEVIKHNPEFQTMIPKLFGLPDIEGNTAEGYIIKPITPIHLTNGDRVILKYKCAKFKEDNSTPISTEVPTEVIAISEHLGEYITENRLNSVCSKESEDILVPKNFGLLIKLLVADAIEEYNREHTTYLTLEPNTHHLVNKMLSKRAQPLVKKKLGLV